MSSAEFPIDKWRRTGTGIMTGMSRRLRKGLMVINITYFDKERVRWNPVTVQIEATSKCNLRCPGCSHSQETESGVHLSVDLLQEILDRLPFSPKHIVLSGV